MNLQTLSLYSGGVLVLLIGVLIHGDLIAFLIALNLLGEKQPKFTKTSTTQRI